MYNSVQHLARVHDRGRSFEGWCEAKLRSPVRWYRERGRLEAGHRSGTSSGRRAERYFRVTSEIADAYRYSENALSATRHQCELVVVTLKLY